MFENLIDRLESSFKLLKGEGKITEINVAETLKDIRKALLDADVSYKIAKTFCDDVKQKALGQNVLKAVRPGQMLTKIVHDELTRLMGNEATDISVKGNPGIVLVAGLQGSGKTTFSGKLALNCKSKRGLKTLLIAGDVYRPAAIDQLKVLGGQIGVDVYSEDGVKDPVQIAKNGIEKTILTINSMKLTKKDLLKETIKHVDITSFDSSPIIDSMRDMSFTSRDTASAADILQLMINDKKSTNWLIIAGSTSAGGCMQVYVDMLRFNMIDCVVSTGASIIDMDFFEALGFKHYKGTQFIDDTHLRDNYIDRIYDTYIDEEELQRCDATIKEIADSLEPRPYSSREFIFEIGKWLSKNSVKKNSLIQTAYELNVPIFVPAFSDCSAGFGLVMHQVERMKEGKPYMTIDSVADFRELTEVKLSAETSGLFMIGGGVPKNFAQDTVVCAECLGFDVPMHQYAVQITVADVRDGACSSSTLKEANSWGKVNTAHEQMVYAEATTVVPLIVSYAYNKGDWKNRTRKDHAKLFVNGTKGSGLLFKDAE